jgi:hypothetical protein
MKLEQENTIIRKSLEEKETQKQLIDKINELDEFGQRYAD